jgi:hypothetical protein
MMRNVFFPAAAWLVFLAVVGAAGRVPGDDVSEPLKSRYPTGSIYLSATTIHDLWVLLNNKEKFADLCKQPPPGETTLEALRAFLNEHPQKRVPEFLAFLQLDFVHGQALFKNLADNDGAIQSVTWSKQEVRDIAVFCDEFLRRLRDLEKLRKEINSGFARLGETWRRLEAAKKDTMLPDQRVAPLLDGFRALIRKRSDELDELKTKDHDTQQRIEAFKTKYDELNSKINLEFGDGGAHVAEILRRKHESAIRSFEEATGERHSTASVRPRDQSELPYLLERRDRE